MRENELLYDCLVNGVFNCDCNNVYFCYYRKKFLLFKIEEDKEMLLEYDFNLIYVENV